MSQSFNHRGRGYRPHRGGGPPQIYKGGRVHLDRNAIFDRRFAISNSNPHSSTGTVPNDHFQQQPNHNSIPETLGSHDQTHWRPNNQHKKPQQEFPQDKRFFCEKCFRGYNTQFMYEQHLASHVKCTHEGCKFEANPWFLAKHIMNVHSMGILAVGSREANEKWINERKRKFPSQAIVQEKQENEQEKVKRGEVVVATNKFGKFKIGESSAFKTAKEREQNENVESEKPSTTTFAEKSVNISWAKNEQGNAGGEEIPEKVKRILDEAQKEKMKISKKAKKNDEIEKPTLLEMLLKDDIVRERNLLLQCVRYIVGNNFFDRSQVKKEKL